MLASKGGKGPSTHKDCCSLVFQAQGRLQPDKAETQDCSLATACGQHQVMGLWPITLLHVTRPKTVPAVQCDVPCMLRHRGPLFHTMGPMQLSQCYGYRAYTQTTRKARICTGMHATRCRPPHAPEDMLNPARHAPRGAEKSELHAPCVRHTQRPQCLPARPLAPRGKSSSSRPSKRCWSHRITQLHNTHTDVWCNTPL